MRRRMPLVTFAALFLLTQCAEHDPARRFASNQVSTSTSDEATAAALISQYRAAHGLPPVSVDAHLTEAAKAQARTVAEAGTLSHGRFASRMDAFGIGGVSAENLSAGSRTVCVNGAAARLVQVGDPIIVISYAQMTPDEAARHHPTIVLLNADNSISETLAGDRTTPIDILSGSL